MESKFKTRGGGCYCLGFCLAWVVWDFVGLPVKSPFLLSHTFSIPCLLSERRSVCHTAQALFQETEKSYPSFIKYFFYTTLPNLSKGQREGRAYLTSSHMLRSHDLARSLLPASTDEPDQFQNSVSDNASFTCSLHKYIHTYTGLAFRRAQTHLFLTLFFK